MDILQFLNSKSVANYLQEIDYHFTAQEAAFVIAHSRKPFKKKCAAWEELIKTMPDCPVVCRFDYPQYPSLHEFLRDYMSLAKRLGKKAKEEELRGGEYHLFTAFEFMWFATPAPFQKGDIVYNVTDKKRQPFVVTDLSFWDAENVKRRQEKDNSDMSAHGYVLRNGHLDYDWTANYLDFEYDRKPLEDINRALFALSNYLKEKIDLEKFLNAYLLICDEERIGSTKKSLCVDDEGLKLAGLKK